MLATGRPPAVGKDYFWSKTVALLSGEGTNGSTTITDSSLLASNWTANGSVTVSTAQYKFGAASLAFNGSAGNHVTATAAGSNFTFGTGDFTIEAWIYATVFTGIASRVIIDFRPASTNGAYPALYVTDTGSLRYFVSSVDRITGATLSPATWYHVAVCRSGSSTRLFVDGAQSGSTWTASTNLSVGASRPAFGANGYSSDLQNWNGYLDGIRITKGAARYTASFTAPTSAHPTRG